MAGRKLKVAEERARTLPDLRASVDETIAAMPWLTEADRAMCDLARATADQIEDAVGRSELMAELIREAGGDVALIKRIQALEAQCEVTKVVGWLGQQLQGYLKELMGSPASRKAMGSGAPVGRRVAEIRGMADRAKGGTAATD